MQTAVICAIRVHFNDKWHDRKWYGITMRRKIKIASRCRTISCFCFLFDTEIGKIIFFIVGGLLVIKMNDVAIATIQKHQPAFGVKGGYKTDIFMPFYQLYICKWVERNGHAVCFLLIGTRKIKVIHFINVKTQVIERSVNEVESVLYSGSVKWSDATNVMLPYYI